MWFTIQQLQKTLTNQHILTHRSNRWSHCLGRWEDVIGWFFKKNLKISNCHILKHITSMAEKYCRAILFCNAHFRGNQRQVYSMNTIMAKKCIFNNNVCSSKHDPNIRTAICRKKYYSYIQNVLWKACKLCLVAYCAQHLAAGWSWLFQMLNASPVKTGFYCGDCETGREEERYRKQSIAAKGASVFCVSLYLCAYM